MDRRKVQSKKNKHSCTPRGDEHLTQLTGHKSLQSFSLRLSLPEHLNRYLTKHSHPDIHEGGVRDRDQSAEEEKTGRELTQSVP